LKKQKQIVSQSRQTKELTQQNQLILAETSETKSVQLSVYMDYFRAAGWSTAFFTFLFFTGYQGHDLIKLLRNENIHRNKS